MLAGRRYRLLFTPEQTAFAGQVASICRTVWNTALEQRRAYRHRGGQMTYAEQARQLAEAKGEFPWLAEAPSHVLQQTLMDLDRACRAHGTWKIRWRSARRWSPSFRFPYGPGITVERLGRKAGRVKLPKFGWVRFRWSRPPAGRIRSATVSREGTSWYISILVEDSRVTPQRHALPETAVGLDMGVAVAVASSGGGLFDRAFATLGELRRIRCLQRRLARQQVRSARRRVTREKLAVLHARIRTRRKDFAAQTACVLATDNAVIAVEALRVRNMTRSARRTATEPGPSVRSKSRLNRVILDKGWHLLNLALRNKARYTGTRIVTVNPAYTSLTCYACKSVDPKSRESQAVFRCTACGHQDHADVNAAKNIMAAGLAVTGRGDLAVGRSVKRQPTTARSAGLVAIPGR